jgi:hypothetical protein
MVWFIGMIANQAGFQVSMWLLLIGLLGLVLFVTAPLSRCSIMDYD